MKVLISDSISEKGIEILKKEVDVDVKTELEHSELVEIIKDYDALIVRSQTKVTKDVIYAGKKLKIIGRAGVGVDNIDVKAATEKGIIVVNSPEGNTISAAEHTIAMMLAMSRNIPQAHASVKSKKWERKKFMGVEVRDKILGVIGIGRIGGEVVKRAHGLEMKILAYDPFISPDRAKEIGVELTTIEDIVKRADYITVHTPLTKETRNIIDKKEFSIMKKGAKIINCARGGIINENALAEALKNGIVSAAALDVFENEPPFDSPLMEFDNVIMTPHLGASTKEAQINVAVSVSKQILEALKGNPVKNAINMPYVKPDVMKFLEPYFPLAEKMGKMCAQIIDGNYEKIEISYNGEISDKQVSPITSAILKGLLEYMLGSGVNYVNAPIIAKDRKIKVVESKSKTIDNFPSEISLKVIKNDKETCITGSVIGNEPHIIKINGYRVDIVPSNCMIIVKYKDKPNVIGPCCTILGKNNINIARIGVGRADNDAIMVLNIDNCITNEIIKEIKNVDNVIEVSQVIL